MQIKQLKELIKKDDDQSLLKILNQPNLNAVFFIDLDNAQNNALHFAVMEASNKVLTLLLIYAHHLASYRNRENKTPFELAIREGKSIVVKQFLTIARPPFQESFIQIAKACLEDANSQHRYHYEQIIEQLNNTYFPHHSLLNQPTSLQFKSITAPKVTVSSDEISNDHAWKNDPKYQHECIFEFDDDFLNKPQKAKIK